MKEKRYYCDLALGKSDKKEDRKFEKMIVISVFIVVTVSSLIYYNIIMNNYGSDLEAYSESSYKYLNEIADNVISKDGINMSAIPKDVVKYEITYEDDKIVFKYYIDNNKGREFATSANMTITLSEDFKVLSKKANFSSKEEYITSHKKFLYILILSLGMVTWCVLAMIGVFIMLVAIPISMMHKKNDIKKNLS